MKTSCHLLGHRSISSNRDSFRDEIDTINLPAQASQINSRASVATPQIQRSTGAEKRAQSRLLREVEMDRPRVRRPELYRSLKRANNSF